jgi:hypothetical protein
MKQFPEEVHAGRIHVRHAAQVEVRRSSHFARTSQFVHPRLQELALKPENGTRIGSFERCDPKHGPRLQLSRVLTKAIAVPFSAASNRSAV